mmetsp:Transcript_2018/g.7189  ORF Transcript_2018/g.7189 Transcript_2018/m.7189 type:complete len:209 (+) Transcript_2018:325-951(+)
MGETPSIPDSTPELSPCSVASVDRTSSPAGWRGGRRISSTARRASVRVTTPRGARPFFISTTHTWWILWRVISSRAVPSVVSATTQKGASSSSVGSDLTAGSWGRELDQETRCLMAKNSATGSPSIPKSDPVMPRRSLPERCPIIAPEAQEVMATARTSFSYMAARASTVTQVSGTLTTGLKASPSSMRVRRRMGSSALRPARYRATS